MKFTKQTLRAFEKMMIHFMIDNGWNQFRFVPGSPFYSLLGLAEVRPCRVISEDGPDQWVLEFIRRDEEHTYLKHPILAQELLSSIHDYNRLWDEMMELAKLQY